jgi:hypothetical protein
MRRMCFGLCLALTFVLDTAANAQTPSVDRDVPRAPPTNVVPAPDTSGNSAGQRSDFKILVPDGFGGLKEAPGMNEGAPDQTGSTTTLPTQPLTAPNNIGNQ